MGLSDFIGAFADVQRRKRGLPTQEQHDQTLADRGAKASHDALSNEQLLAQIVHSGALTKQSEAETAALPVQQDLNRRVKEAQIRNYDEPNRATKPAEDPIDAALRRRKIEAQIKRLGMAPGGAAKAPGRPYPANIGGKDVLVDPNTRQPIPGMAPQGTAQIKNREEQAGIIINAGAQLKQAIDAAKDVVGPRAGRFQQAQEGGLGMITGGADKRYTGLKSQLKSFEALLPILHGFRGGSQIMAQFEQALGGGLNQDPENLKAALDSVVKLATDVANGRAVQEGGNSHSPEALTHNDAPDEGSSQLSPEEEAILKDLMQ